VIKELIDHGYAVLNVDVAPPSEPLCRFMRADLTDLGEAIDAMRVAAGTVIRARAPLGDPFAVIHHAGIPAPAVAPDATIFEKDLMSTYNVFTAATRVGMSRVVWASSETIYGLPFTRTPRVSVPIRKEDPVKPETGYALTKILSRSRPQPIEHYMWTRLPFTLGPMVPKLSAVDPTVSPASELAMQKSFVDFAWNMPIGKFLDGQPYAETGEYDFDETAAKINDGNARFVGEAKSFAKTYNSEVRGLFDLVGERANEVLGCVARQQGIDLPEPSEAERRDTVNEFKKLFRCHSRAGEGAFRIAQHAHTDIPVRVCALEHGSKKSGATSCTISARSCGAWLLRRIPDRTISGDHGHSKTPCPGYHQRL
jgi:hypothetical protein